MQLTQQAIMSSSALLAGLSVLCFLFAFIASSSNQVEAVSINIWKHRYPFYGGYGGYYPFWGGYGGYGGGYGGIGIGGIGIGGGGGGYGR